MHTLPLSLHAPQSPGGVVLRLAKKGKARTRHVQLLGMDATSVVSASWGILACPRSHGSGRLVSLRVAVPQATTDVSVLCKWAAVALGPQGRWE